MDTSYVRPVRLVGDPGRRLSVAVQIAGRLTHACPGSESSLRGSLAWGGADVFSDIDMAWVLPDAEFRAGSEHLPRALASVAPLASLGSDPDHRRSPLRRLLSARFAGFPLLWQLDLEVWAASIAFDMSIVNTPIDDTSIDNAPGLVGEEWSGCERALNDALTAIKAVLRGHRGRPTPI